jgi:hypothetical protein
MVAVHRKKKVREFPVPSRDVTTKLSLGGNNDVITELFLPRGSLVSHIPAGDGKLVNLFLRCSCPTPCVLYLYLYFFYLWMLLYSLIIRARLFNILYTAAAKEKFCGVTNKYCIQRLNY